ncbi:hypothetical protein ACFOVU_08050 [Nocardiopsis sediminis]|uniref:PH domain-containing protein n=1 Tax=Nocardiopsis sediminis TaxID=1778267 RepID=A0ABV8FLT9_9ACTN
MPHPPSQRVVRTVRLGSPPPRRIGDLELRIAGIVGLGSFGLLLTGALLTLVDMDLDRGRHLAEALWVRNRALTITTAVCLLLLAVVVTASTCGVPRTLTRRAVAVGDLGLEVAERPVWRFRSRRAFIAWDDVHVIDVWRYGVRAAGAPRPAKRVVIDLYLHRDVPGLPSFAVRTRAGGLRLDGRRGIDAGTPVVRIGGDGSVPEQDVRELAETIGGERPDLLHR